MEDHVIDVLVLGKHKLAQRAAQAVLSVLQVLGVHKGWDAQCVVLNVGDVFEPITLVECECATPVATPVI